MNPKTYEPFHMMELIDHLIFLDKSPATNTFYPDEMSKEPCHDLHHTDPMRSLCVLY